MDAYKRNIEKRNLREQFSQICLDEIPRTLEQKYYHRLLKGEEDIDSLVPPQAIVDDMVLIRN